MEKRRKTCVEKSCVVRLYLLLVIFLFCFFLFDLFFFIVFQYMLFSLFRVLFIKVCGNSVSFYKLLFFLLMSLWHCTFKIIDFVYIFKYVLFFYQNNTFSLITKIPTKFLKIFILIYVMNYQRYHKI